MFDLYIALPLLPISSPTEAARHEPRNEEGRFTFRRHPFPFDFSRRSLINSSTNGALISGSYSSFELECRKHARRGRAVEDVEEEVVGSLRSSSAARQRS
jgi:hypothetical protein